MEEITWNTCVSLSPGAVCLAVPVRSFLILSELHFTCPSPMSAKLPSGASIRTPHREGKTAQTIAWKDNSCNLTPRMSGKENEYINSRIHEGSLHGLVVLDLFRIRWCKTTRTHTGEHSKCVVYVFVYDWYFCLNYYNTMPVYISAHMDVLESFVLWW